jgi:hypothetical protein
LTPAEIRTTDTPTQSPIRTLNYASRIFQNYCSVRYVDLGLTEVEHEMGKLHSTAEQTKLSTVY